MRLQTLVWAAVSRLNECFPAEAPSTKRKEKIN
jgi:hypothetical protein